MLYHCQVCSCLLPLVNAVIPDGMTLNRTTDGRGQLVHHVCLPLKGSKWDYFRAGNNREPGFFLPRKTVTESHVHIYNNRWQCTVPECGWILPNKLRDDRMRM